MTMRRSLLAPVAFILLATCASDESSTPTSAEVCSSNLSPGVFNTALTAGGATHAVRIYIPPVPAGTGVLPVVLNWHGLGAGGTTHAAYSEYEALAETEGFIVVHPTGKRSPDLPVLNMGAGWELIPGLDTAERDDLAFASALIDELVANWCADSTRIFSIGFSNGSFFTSALVCELADRIAGAASVAGLYHPDSCEPSRNVPYIVFEGVDDQIVPFETGGPTIYPELRDTMFALGAFDAFAAFAAQFGCDAEPVSSAAGDEVTRYDYQNCDDDTPMVFYAFGGVTNGHSWPGSSSEESTTADLNATLESWHFFEALP
jgi:polyhydroxybutyrate depolymerase